MNKNKLLISIIVPTLNSQNYIETLLKSIKSQKNNKYEVIIVDNGSDDSTLKIAKKFRVKVIDCKGKPPQVAKQRHIGASVAKGEYLYFMDHDMELSMNFLKNFSNKMLDPEFRNKDAWYVQEKIITNSKILSIVRNFEADFLRDTVISAARIIKKNAYLSINGYDKKLSAGPADWDLNIQLTLADANFGNFNKFVFHHEENLNIKSYIFKKTLYIKGEEIYKRKWRKNKKIYSNIVTKQYSLKYRIFWIFIENQKWKELIRNIDKYLLFLIIKLLLVTVYVYKRKKYEK